MTALYVLLALAVAGMFGWSAFVKLAGAARWTDDVRRYRFPQPVKRGVILAVPWAEIAVALLILTGHLGAGSLLALVLLAGFSAAIVRLQRVLSSKAVPCGCLGSSVPRDYRLLLARNGALGLGAFVVLTASPASDLTEPVGPVATTCVAAVWFGAAIAWAVWYTTSVYRSEHAHR